MTWMCDESETAFSVISLSKPFNIHTAMIRAVTPIATPRIEMSVIKEMNLNSWEVSFLGIRNLFARNAWNDISTLIT